MSIKLLIIFNLAIDIDHFHPYFFTYSNETPILQPTHIVALYIKWSFLRGKRDSTRVRAPILHTTNSVLIPNTIWSPSISRKDPELLMSVLYACWTSYVIIL